MCQAYLWLQCPLDAIPHPILTLFPYTTLFRSRMARELGVEVLFLRPRHELYGQYSRRLMDLLRSETPLLEQRCLTDRKSTRLNSSHMSITYAVFCLKK